MIFIFNRDQFVENVPISAAAMPIQACFSENGRNYHFMANAVYFVNDEGKGLLLQDGPLGQQRSFLNINL